MSKDPEPFIDTLMDTPGDLLGGILFPEPEEEDDEDEDDEE